MEILTLLALGFSIVALYRIKSLDTQIKELRGQPMEKKSVETSTVTNTVSTKSEVTETVSVKPDTSELGIDKLLKWYSHEWPLKTGALFILLGFVWLATYAFLNNWIGPTGRITVGIIAGTLILYLGERRMKVVQTQGITLVGLGAAIAIVTVYAAQNVYSMFPPAVALGFIILIMVLTSIISLKHHILSLALVSLLIGGIAPILIGSPDKSIFGLYSYLLALTAGTLWIARYSKWRILTTISLLIVSVYSVEYFFGSAVSLRSHLIPIEFFQVQFFAITFTSIFFFSTLMSLINNENPSKSDLQTAGLLGLFTLGWINGVVSPEFKGLVSVAAALGYTGASYAVFMKTQKKAPVFIYTAVATTLLAVGTSYQFDGPALVIAFSLQALLLPIVGVSILGVDIGKYLLLYFIIPGIMAFESITGYWGHTLWQNHFYSLIIISLSFFLSGIYFYEKHREKGKPLHEASIVLTIIGSVFGLVLIWKVFHTVYIAENIASMIILFIYTALGLGAYVYGEMQKRTVVNKFGLGLLIFVMGRLLIVEVWNMELTTRIITFFLIGLLFIGSVLLRKSTTKKT